MLGWIPRRTELATVLVMLTTVVLTVSPIGQNAHAAESRAVSPRVAYTITVPSKAASTLEISVLVPAQGMTFDIELPRGVTTADTTVSSLAGSPPGLEAVAAHRMRVHPQGTEPIIISYWLPLRPSIQNPASRPEAPYSSVHLGEFLYVAGRDTLALVSGAMVDTLPVAVRLALPDDWDAFAVDIGTVRPGDDVPVDKPMELVLLLGPLSVSSYELPDGRLTLVTVGDMPWEPAEAAASIEATAAPLYRRSIAGLPGDITFVQIRYPGALRLNPLVAGHVLSPGTIIHWIGTGGVDWWRRYAARDLVGLFVETTVAVAPDASWFVAGLPEYVGLLVLHEAGFITVDELYNALRTLYTTGVHYTGPAWPSLILAGVASPRSHAAERVLQFRAPLVAFLLDSEIRVASDGRASIIHLWADLADEQRRKPDLVFHTASLLPPLADFGDLSTFAEDFIFGSRIPPPHFDAVYQRWPGDSE